MQSSYLYPISIKEYSGKIQIYFVFYQGLLSATRESSRVFRNGTPFFCNFCLLSVPRQNSTKYITGKFGVRRLLLDTPRLSLNPCEPSGIVLSKQIDHRASISSDTYRRSVALSSSLIWNQRADSCSGAESCAACCTLHFIACLHLVDVWSVRSR